MPVSWIIPESVVVSQYLLAEVLSGFYPVLGGDGLVGDGLEHSQVDKMMMISNAHLGPFWGKSQPPLGLQSTCQIKIRFQIAYLTPGNLKKKMCWDNMMLNTRKNSTK